MLYTAQHVQGAIISFLKSLLRPQTKQPLSPPIDLEPAPPQLAAKRLVLEELRNVLTHQFEAGDALDGKLKELLGTASLILSLVTTLQVIAGIEHIGWLYWISLSCVLVLYVSLIIVILRGLRPMQYHAPIPSNWDEIEDRFFDLNEDVALDLLIVNYLEYSKENRTPLDYKAAKVRQASILLVLIVLTLVAMGLFGLSSNMPLPWQSPLPAPASIP